MADSSVVESATGQFKTALARGQDWGTTAKACLDRLGLLPAGANLGIVYATDLLASDLGSIVTFLRERTGIADWVGTVGLGVAAAGPGEGGEEAYDEPALAVMVCALPASGYRLLPALQRPDPTALRAALADWPEAGEPLLGLVHADPRNRQVGEIIGSLSQGAGEGGLGAYLVGGLSSSRGGQPQIAGRESDGGVSGLLLGADCPLLVGLTQGCTPIGPVREITRAEGNVVQEIDGRPAFEVFKEDIGELLAHDLRRVAGYIFVGFPIPGRDRGTGGGDYLVRNLAALDAEHGWVGVGEEVEAGQRILFCRRDGQSATRDLDRMLADLVERADGKARAAIYISCIARGVNLFGPKSAELRRVSEALGDIPLVGFFANGEICNDRLYGYTGVLALFV